MENKLIQNFKYRPAIDGLRAIAVLAVVVFHLDHDWLPGGFVGVDVFFVISGYLITSIILRDCVAGKFSLLNFYQRRIARIFPAFFTVGLCTLVGAFLIYTPQDLASAGANLSAAALSVANMKYMVQGAYFEISPDAQPYLHYWSLSVEEQFYVFFPLFFMIIFKFSRKRMLLILLLLGGGSFVFCVMMTMWKPVWAFYLLPARGWQLLAGCILAVTYTQNTVESKWMKWLPILGLSLIIMSFVIIHEGSHFPGWWALLPTLGAIGVLVPVRSEKGIVERVLSKKFLVLIGRMSYSLYLWHWPIFSLVDYQMYMASDSARLIWKIALSLFAAILSLRFIENPARRFLNKRKARPLAYASVVGVLLFCVVLGIWVRKINYVDASQYDLNSGGLVFSSDPNVGTVVLMGDSNGSMYGKIIRDVCHDLNRKLIVVSMSSGNALPSLNGKNSQLWEKSLDVVKKENPDYVILACRWENNLKNGNEGRFDLAIDSISPYTKQIIVFNQPPTLPPNATRSDMRNGVRPPFFEDEEIRPLRLQANSYILKHQRKNAFLLDVASLFELPSGEIPFVDKNGRQIYQDKNHLSGYGADLIRSQIMKALSGKR